MYLDSCMPIPLKHNDSINHMAFDGCDYFCTIRCKSEIIRFSPCHSAVQRYCTCREYDHICYDYSDHCFWASSSKYHHTIFKLDCCMRELDCICICVPDLCGMITGISYNCCKNALVISFPHTVIEVEKESDSQSILYSTPSGVILGVLSLCPGLLLTVLRGSRYVVDILNQDGEKIGCYALDSTLLPQDLLFNPCTSSCQPWQILIFGFKRNCYPYLCDSCISEDDLGFTPCCCNNEICHECCCCDPSCSDPQKDIMESIALIEAALSHILNAEGEKIQKALATTDDLDKIMCVNREVNKTIVNVTHLEHTLYDKLSALSDCSPCDDPCCDKPCCDQCEEQKNCREDAP